jgi:hypothetical protein
MSASDDPFDARPTSELLATDALLDRVGARAPTPDDLDDPLVAALALMAAEIDLDPVPVEDTRAALARVRPDPAPTPIDPPLAGDRSGVVIDLRDVDPLEPAGRDELRGPRRRPRPVEPAAASVAMAPPRSLPRMPAPGGAPGGSRRPEGRRQRKLRPMVAVAVAVTAIVLGSGVSAAVTGGRSVNPLDGVQQVVAQLTGGRTPEQAVALQKATTYLRKAEAAVEARDTGTARSELAKITPQLLAQLTGDDKAVIKAGITRLEKDLRR